MPEPLGGAIVEQRHRKIFVKNPLPEMRILIVEDHPDVAANLGDYLGAAGHRVDFAADGPTGLKLAQTGEFDVVVLDRMLPGLDGATLCQKLRTESRIATPV